MAETILRSGAPMTIDYTPTAANHAEGEVVLLGNTTSPTCGIAPRPILNNTKGALSIGGGQYDIPNLNNSALHALVYWDQTNNVVTSVSTNNPIFGFIVGNAAGGVNSLARVLHWPFV